MDKFETQFENLDVQTEYMENSMGQTTAITTPGDQVDELMQQVADEHSLQLEMPTVSSGALASGPKESNELGERLARLRG